MAEQTFKSPGFFEREIEVISRPINRNIATPVGLIGPAQRGPAFVPTTVSSREEFIRIFGAPDRHRLGGHAAAEFFRNQGKALTFCRTLGSGLVDGANAGFKLTHTATDAADYSKPVQGAVHFITAQHTLNDAEFIGLASFNDNDSHTTNMNESNLNDQSGATDKGVELVRAMIFAHKDYAVKIKNIGETETEEDDDDIAVAASSSFLILFDDDGTKTTPLEVSLDPSSEKYISKVMNTDPLAFDDEKHLLYAHFPVDTAVAEVGNLNVAVVHGSSDANATHYGNFSQRFSAPQTPKFISQPFGTKEYDLFHFESLDDGAYASGKYKISISNLRASTDPTNDFGTFSVAIRDVKDTDDSPIVYETFTNCSLDPDAENFVGRVIGDQKIYYNFDSANEDERRLILEGTHKNISSKVRIVMSDDVLNGEVPQTALPFGFRGVPALLITDNARDAGGTSFVTGETLGEDNLDKAVLPPLPYRFKVTKGDIRDGGSSYGQTFTGEASDLESVNFNLHWGLMSTRVEDINNVNKGIQFNEIVTNYTKFLGASETTIKTGAFADSHNNNKFSLAKVALSGSALSSISGTIDDVFKNAAYIRNADADNTTLYDAAQHLILAGASNDNLSADANRVSLAKMLAEDKAKFNRYSVMMKFTAPLHGGFDGLNIFDEDSFFMTDRAASSESNGVGGAKGKAHADGFASGLSGTTNAAMQGSGDSNNIVASYKNAIRIMTDDMVVNHNVLVVPNIRDAAITDFAKRRVEDYGKALYVMDIPQYNSSSERLYVDAKGNADGRPDVDITSQEFDAREVNSSYAAVYFPDARVLDSGDDDAAAVNARRVIRVPSSIVALGALAKTDDEAQPWFAPAGFSRGALSTISSIDVRLNAEDRDTLYEARINPIANFPSRQFVIFGQKTTQLARTALDRVNVRRLVLEVKRRIEIIAQGLLFEQNNKATRDRFIEKAGGQLADIQINQGIEDFRVVMDETNNTSEDVDNNRLNGKIVIVPTRAIEFIAIDFVITNAGVEFP